jgi:CSLREA domain-containing protein
MHTVPKPLPLSMTLLIAFALLLGSALVVKPVSAASIVVNSAEDIIADDGVCTLREAIIAANTDAAYNGCAAGNGADTITFAGNYTITLDGDQLPTISSSITINGNGAASTIIQASECNPVTLPGGCTPASHNVFEVASSGTLTLDGVTVRHGNAYSGGGIMNEGILNISNSTIAANRAETYGGGILNEGIGAVTTITNSNVINNRSFDFGGGVSISNGTLTVTSSTFSNNAATNYGGGVNNAFGTLNVISSTFSENVASNNGGGFYNLFGTATVTNSTFLNNITSGYGGGISNFVGTVTVTNSTFSENVAFYGGGLNNLSGNVTVTSSNLSDNTAYDGGAIYTNWNLTINGSTISGNQANNKGGGVFNKGTLEVDQSTFEANDADLGGGIRNDEGPTSKITVTGSTFHENTAAHGAAVDNWGDGPNLINTSSLIENSATASGGGIRNWSVLTVRNSSISGNSAISVNDGLNNQEPGVLTLQHVTFNQNQASSGGGIYTGSKTTLTYMHTIVAGSTNGDCFNAGTIHSDSTHNLVEDGSCFLATNLEGDPLLGPLADNGGPTLTHALLPGSPAIDAGSGALCQAFDQRGVARPQGAACDIGAFEVEQIVVINNSNAGAGSLRQAIIDIPPGGIITFSPDLSGETVTLSASLVISSNLSIDGSALPEPITISGNGAVGVFIVNPSTNVTLDSLRIMDGNTSDGGGINNSGILSIVNCTITGNTASGPGGGITNNPYANLLIRNSIINDNTATNYGGGIHSGETLRSSTARYQETQQDCMEVRLIIGVVSWWLGIAHFTVTYLII